MTGINEWVTVTTFWLRKIHAKLKIGKMGVIFVHEINFFFEIFLVGLSELHLMAVTVRWLKMIVYIFKENSWFAQSGGLKI